MLENLLFAAAVLFTAWLSWTYSEKAKKSAEPTVPQTEGGHWLFGFLFDTHNLNYNLVKAARQAPVNTYRIGFMKWTLINDVDFVKKCFASTSQHFSSEAKTAFALENLFDVDPEDKWRPMRRRINQSFTTPAVNAMLPLVRESAKATVHRLREQVEAASAGEYLNMEPIVMRAVMDSLVRCVFSREFDESKDWDRIHCIDKIGQNKPADFFENVPVLKYLYNPFKKDYVKYLEMSMRMSTDELDQRRKMYAEDPDNVPKDIISNLLGFNIKATADDMELTENMMVHNISMFFFAGLDTTSNSFLFALAELAKNPRVLKKAQDEVDRLFDELLASGEELDFNSQNKLQYIDQIFKESLRLYTVAPGAPRVVCREDLVLGPYVLPKGCIMLMNAAGIHRQPQHWERPDEFYPEHFDEAAVASRDPHAFIPFGGGARACIGIKLAQMEQRVIMAYFIRHFNFEMTTARTMHMIEPLRMRLSVRF